MVKPWHILLLGGATAIISVSFFTDEPTSQAFHGLEPERQPSFFSPVPTDAPPQGQAQNTQPVAASSADQLLAIDPIDSIQTAEPLEIGEPISVDEDAWWQESGDLIEIGEPLDADDPLSWIEQESLTEIEPLEIGEVLDADAPWDREESTDPPVNIGPVLNADPSDQ